MKQYLIYHIRWQLSAWIMMPVIYQLKELPLWMSFCISQFVGAIIFWYVDKRIFSKEDII
jgi:hypothetical protein